MQCEKYTFVPDSPEDTLMACFCLFLKGKETRPERKALRARLMDRLYATVQSDECFQYASVRAMVHRMHAIQPEQVPKSAEVFYIRDRQRFMREAVTFVTQNRREGFVGDMFTFGYLFAECFKVDVHLFCPDEITLSVVAFAKYHLHICYADGRFALLLPRQKQAAFERPRGVIRSPSRTSLPVFRVATIDKSFAPPNILDYRVHHVCLYDVGYHKIEPIRSNWRQLLREGEYAYVCGRILNAEQIRLISCVSRQGQCGPRFYVDVVPFELFVVIEKDKDEALRAIRIEQSF